MKERYLLMLVVGLIVTVFLSSAVSAFVVKDSETYLDQVTFRDMQMGTRTEPVPLADALKMLPADHDWQLFLREHGPAEIHIDTLTMMPSVVNFRGLRWVEGDPLAAEQADRLTRTALKFIAANRGLFFDLPLEMLQLNEQRSGAFGENGYLYYIDFDVAYENVPIEGARVVFRCNNGNMVQFGVEGMVAIPGRLSDVFDPVPYLTVDDVLEIAFIHAGGFNPKTDVITEPGTLKFVPRQVKSTAKNWGNRFEYPLVWEVAFTREGLGGTWRAQVNAHTGELLGFWDDNRYGSVQGGMYPISPAASTEVKRGLPYADIRNTSNTIVGYTDGSGSYAYTSGTLKTTLSSKYVVISDKCGAISMSTSAAPGDIDLGMSTGTNCTTPGIGGAGNTHAARSCFYHVNVGKYRARQWLPSISWLNNALTSVVNLTSSDSSYCPGNAWWDGSKINFCVSGSGAGNTGEIAAIFLHEFAHGLDSYDGSSSSDKATGETYADTFAFIQTHSSCGGPGFFTSNCSGYGDACTSCTGVREFDYAKHTSGTAHTLSGFVKNNCPTDSSYYGPCGREGHCESYPPSEAMWDLAVRDLPSLGYDQATSWYIFERLFFLSRPTSGSFYSCSNFVGSGCSVSNWHQTFLVVDDNDGNLSNGTPRASAIKNALQRHGVSCTTSTSTNYGCSTMTKPTLTATAGNNSVALSWTAVSGASQYAILRNDLGCDYGYIRIASTTSTTYTDNEVFNGMNFYYRVVAIASQAACMSPLSDCKTVMPTSGGSTTYSISGAITVSGSGLAAVNVAYTGAASGNVSTDASGNYTIAGLINGTYTITPTKTGYTFTPTSLSKTISSANQTGANFTATAQSTDTQLTSGTGVAGSVALQAWKYYYITVPANASKLVIATTNSSADIDLYTNFNAKPTATTYACRPYSSSGNETCTHDNPTAGTWWAGVYGYKAGSYTITATITAGTSTYSITGTISQSGGSAHSGVTVTLSGAATGNTTTNTSGVYTFSGLANGSYTVTPSLANFTFTPTSRAVSISGANQTGQNFTSAASGGGDTQLTSGVAVNSQSVALGAWKYYYITVPSGATNLEIKTTNATADIDLYTNFNAKPTSTTYACRPYTSSGNETCTHASPSAGTWWAGVYGYKAGNYSITATVTAGGTTYTISGNVSGATSVAVNLTGAASKSTTTDGSGNYSFTGLANGSYTVTPSKTNFAFTPTSRAVTISGANQTGQNFTATDVTDSTKLNSGVAVTGSVTLNAMKYYYIVVPAGATSLTVTLTGLSADIDLYTKYNAKPTTAVYDCRSWNSGTTNETCSHTNPAAGIWFIAAHGYAAGNFTVKATVTTAK